MCASVDEHNDPSHQISFFGRNDPLSDAFFPKNGFLCEPSAPNPRRQGSEIATRSRHRDRDGIFTRGSNSSRRAAQTCSARELARAKIPPRVRKWLDGASEDLPRNLRGVTHGRMIAHVDLDAFFASVEQLDDPMLVGVPVLVGGIGPRSVVAAASYEARAFGCRSAMPMGEARRRCPHAVVRPPRSARYRELSDCFMHVLRQFSPLVEAISVDEAFVDLTGTERLLGPAAESARAIAPRVLEATGLHCSVGLASSKFVAKIASDLKKPRGMVVVPLGETRDFLAPLDIARMWGVGPVAEKRFRARGYERFRDLQRVDEGQVVRDLGESGRHAWKLAQGMDDRSLESEHASKSIGQEQTFDSDTSDCHRLRAVLLQQTEHVAIQLRRQGCAARTVTVKFRTGDFQTTTKRISRAVATDVTSELWCEVCAIFDRWVRAGVVPIRLIGVSASGIEARQDSASLFADPHVERQRRLDSVADSVRARFGAEAIRRASGASERSNTQ